MPGIFRQVKLLTMKRKHINLARDDKYGHWWFEIGDPFDPGSESYGWWPFAPVGLTRTLLGVAGELNGQTNFGGQPTRDPHHGDAADEGFHPWVAGTDTRTDAEIAECLRQFARTYRGAWQWVFGTGQNCHTFQSSAMQHCRLLKSPPKNWF
jgi:hypothetical protein